MTKNNEKYALDRYGNRIYKGDYVKCVAKDFMVGIGENRRVTHISSPHVIEIRGMTFHDSHNFRLSGRYHPYHRNPAKWDAERLKKEPKEMLHIAILVGEGQNYNSIANNIGRGEKPPTMAETSMDALKERVRDNIKQYPSNRWLLLSGNTIAEMSAPPVAFRIW